MGSPALKLLRQSLRAARFDPAGVLIRHEDQDQASGKGSKIPQAHALFYRAPRRGQPQPDPILAGSSPYHARTTRLQDAERTETVLAQRNRG